MSVKFSAFSSAPSFPTGFLVGYDGALNIRVSFNDLKSLLGLSNFTESTAVIGAKRYNQLIAEGALDTNIDAVFAPKGNGAFLSQRPDNDIPGGNMRGLHAVDLQRARTAATQVARGDYSSITGGQENHIDEGAHWSHIGSGRKNRISAQYSRADGHGARAMDFTPCRAFHDNTFDSGYGTPEGQYMDFIKTLDIARSAGSGAATYNLLYYIPANVVNGRIVIIEYLQTLTVYNRGSSSKMATGDSFVQKGVATFMRTAAGIVTLLNHTILMSYKAASLDHVTAVIDSSSNHIRMAFNIASTTGGGSQVYIGSLYGQTITFGRESA